MSKNVAVIVGAGPGLGHSVALRFAREGFSVALIARKPDNTKATKDAITASNPLISMLRFFCFCTSPKGGVALQVQADVADEAQIVRAFAEIRAHVGNPTVLVHNVVRGHIGNADVLSTAALKEELMVDAVSAFACVHQVLPHMKTQKQGTILFTGGMLSHNTMSPYTAIGMGKAAQRALAQGLASELTPLGIHVAVVTIMGFIAKGTAFDPDAIAEDYWKIHIERGNWAIEHKFTGQTAVDRPVMFSQ